MRDLVIPALNLALVSFVSLMLTARSFAAKNGYEINADAEFRALGIANIMSGLSQGFAISGADSGPRLMIPLEEKVSWYPLSQP
jgi:MFS superfamily sulfate permease-like transporter